MGIGNSTAMTIHLHRENAFYWCNEIVSGTVDLQVIQGTIEVNEIFVSLTGEIGYTTTEQVSDGRGGSSTRTEYHHVPFYSAKGIFARPEFGQDRLTLRQGQYSWPFQIVLTDHLPPTLNEPQSYPHVRYYLQVVIDKPWYKPNTRETRYLTVCPRVNLLHNPQCLMSTVFGNQNRKNLTLKGTLNKLGYVPGELLTLTLDFDNPRRVLIQRVHLAMLQSFRIGPNARGYMIFQLNLPKIVNTNDEHLKETFSVLVPAIPMPPSSQFHGGLHRVIAVQLSYILRLTIHVDGMFTNFDVNIPIHIGTEPHPDLNAQQRFNPLLVTYSANPEQSLFADHDEPPSYDFVVQTSK